MIRVKLVIIKTMDGEKVKEVSSMSNSTDRLYVCPPLGPLPTFNPGIPCAKRSGDKNRAIRINKKTNLKRFRTFMNSDI